MKIITIVIGGILCFSAWHVASRISPDAVSMAVGMLFGGLAGLPTGLLMRGGDRRREDEYDCYKPQPQPPVVIVYPPAQQHKLSALPPLPPLPPYQPKRAIVEREELDEAWMMQP